MSFLLDLLRKIFGFGKKPPAPKPDPKPAPPVNDPNEPANITVNRVLAIIYNPTMDAETGEKLADQAGWHRPADLMTGFSADLQETSHGMMRNEIIERIEVDEFPVKADGFRYSPSQYLDVLHGITPQHEPHQADYQAILDDFNIVERISNNEIDEVWIFAFPYAGFYESVMAGKDAFWCNAPPLDGTAHISRRFVMMGFSYERGVGEMLEGFTHRIESIMEKTFSKTSGDVNLWERYTRYDKKNPGQANLGNVHYAPNSLRDYDWGDPRFVSSNCDDWYNFPDFQGITRQVNASEWGNGDIRLHHRWWMNHIPHVAGRINGVHNNWWQYIMDPQKVTI